MSQHNQISQRSRSPSLRGSTRASDPPPAPLRVLLLEDDADTCEAFESLLCPEDGFELRTTGDVHACVEWLRLASTAGRPYDVLLLDLVLPGGHWGTEVLEAAQHDLEMSLPAVVVCTALSGAYLEAQLPLLDACGARIVSKPFDVDCLLHVLRQAATAHPRS